MDSETANVKIHFKRKWAFAGALLIYKLFINGEYVGSLKNGKELIVEAPMSNLYFIDEMWASTERNGIIRATDLSDASRIFVEIRRAGGWRTESYNEFYLRESVKYIKLPSFDYSRFYEACYDSNLFSKLTEQEKTLTLCLTFFNEISDAADEVLYDERLYEMLDALHSIGATKYLSVFSSVIEQTFSGISLPLTDNGQEDKDIQKRLVEANRIVWNSEKTNRSAEELHKCIVAYITEHLLH